MPTLLSRAGLESGQLRRQVLLNLKCLFYCLHEQRQHYNLNLTLHSIERGDLHADIADSHLGDNVEFLSQTFEGEDLDRLRHALAPILDSRAEMTVGDKQFMIGHYIEAMDDFGPIAAGSKGIICQVTPQLRGLFLLEGPHLMESVFAPSNVRVIYGTYVN